MLHLIGAGLNDEYDLSLKSINMLKNSDHVYLEHYTSNSFLNIKHLEDIINKKLNIATRNCVETANTIIDLASKHVVSLLIVGTPLFATTHTDLILRAKEKNIKVNIIYNASIMNVMGCFGLFSYNFGRTISIPFFTETWKPTSFYEKFVANYKAGLHTICLLAIKVTETESSYMSAGCAIKQLLYCEEVVKANLFKENFKLFVVSGFGSDHEKVYYGEASRYVDFDSPKALHSLILPAEMERLEKEHVAELFDKNGRYLL